MINLIGPFGVSLLAAICFWVAAQLIKSIKKKRCDKFPLGEMVSTQALYRTGGFAFVLAEPPTGPAFPQSVQTTKT